MFSLMIIELGVVLCLVRVVFGAHVSGFKLVVVCEFALGRIFHVMPICCKISSLFSLP